MARTHTNRYPGKCILLHPSRADTQATGLPPQVAATGTMIVPHLEDWAQRSKPAIRHCSDIATDAIDVDLPNLSLAPGQR